MREQRQVTLDFVAVMIVGIVLSLMMAVSIVVNVTYQQDRSDEHHQIDRTLREIAAERRVQTAQLIEQVRSLRTLIESTHT